MRDAAAAASALNLPVVPNTSRYSTSAAFWLAPDQWLLVNDHASVCEVVDDVAAALVDVLHSATDASDALACFVIEGEAARGLLAMGSGTDFSKRRFGAGRCVLTRFAKVTVLIVAISDDRFELIFDRSVTGYVEAWLRRAMKDAAA